MAKRVEKWDLLKFFLIFTVVLGHIAEFYIYESQTMENLFLFIYTFHMPLFIFISGLFSKRTIKENRFDKIAGYLLVYLFIKLLFMLYNLVRYKVFSLNLFNDGGLPWFIFAMFVLPLITCAVKKVKAPIVLGVSLLISLVVGYIEPVGTVLSLSRIIVFFPFFYVGYITDLEKLTRLTDKKPVRFAGAAILVLLFIAAFGFGEYWDYLRALFTGKNSYYTDAIAQHLPYAFLLRLSCYLISALACFSLIAVTPNHSRYRIFATCGKRTISVYVFHYFVLYLLLDHFRLKGILAEMLPSWILVIIIPLSVGIVIMLSLNLFYRPMEKLMKLPAQIIKIKSKK